MELNLYSTILIDGRLKSSVNNNIFYHYDKNIIIII